MSRFFILEMGNLTIALFFLLIAIFIGTRSFVQKSVKKAIFFFVVLFFSLLVGSHYYITSKRMDSVKEAFLKGDDIVCENRMNRKVAQSIVINKDRGWRLEKDIFENDNFNRKFHSARCIVKTKPIIDLKK